MSDWSSDVGSSDLEQRLGDLGVLGLEQPPIAGAGPHALRGGLGDGEVVDMGRNAPHGAHVAPRDEQLRPAMFEPRILAGGQQVERLALQRRHPRPEELTSELQSLMRTSYTAFCL